MRLIGLGFVLAASSCTAGCLVDACISWQITMSQAKSSWARGNRRADVTEDHYGNYTES
jgi:hypothetical protein